MTMIDDVNTAIGQGDYDQAARVAESALGQGLRHPTLFNILAFRESEAGRYEAALALLHQGLDLAPRDVFLLYSAGFCEFRLGRDDAALAAFDSVLAERPGYPAALMHKGLIHERRGQEDEAERFYEQALAADPNYEDPYAGLASVAATRGQFVRARAFADRALALAPHQTTAHLAIAKAEYDEGRFAEVVERLSPLLARGRLIEQDRPGFLALLGDALDGLKRPDEAFAAWSEGKALSKAHYANSPIAQASRRHLDQIAALKPFVDTLEALATPQSRTPGTADAPREHVFLVGFPRSGTTLLEQVLVSHGDVVTLEEKPLLEAAEKEFLVSPASFQRLLDADDDLLDPFRDLYWQLLEARGLKVAGRVFVDKLPLASLVIPVIARLFPDARILFAERDPRDVVLSCFRRGFKMNPSMYQFVTLEGAARFYDGVMSLADRYRRLVPGRVHAVRYEALVADFEVEIREICAFIGLDWRDSLHDFAASARARPIHTPSASQVRKGLYATGSGQWRRYESHLAPILPILAPWVAALGYDA